MKKYFLRYAGFLMVGFAPLASASSQPIIECAQSSASGFNVPFGGTFGGSETIGQGKATMQVYEENGRTIAKIVRAQNDNLPKVMEYEVTNVAGYDHVEINDWLTDRFGRTDFLSLEKHDVVSADLKSRRFDKLLVVVDGSRFSGSALVRTTASYQVGAVRTDTFSARFQNCSVSF